MKKISLVLAGIMMSALASAKEIDKPVPAASSVVVTNSNGSSLFKVHYHSGKEQNVRITVLDKEGNEIFTETLQKTNRFIRPYNFREMEEGQYVIRVEDENGKVVEKVNFSKVKVEKWVNIVKVIGMENKFTLMVSSSKKDTVTISIFDQERNLVHSETREVNKTFAQMYNVKGMDSFSIEVADSNGLVKSMTY
ncbi:hypothetical protein WSM22_38250 [Cytophagales bacterium WSM2-2]|nr:hypothetical protein WSM22_38250 [Cytophagales bacterium WSM2-2]